MHIRTRPLIWLSISPFAAGYATLSARRLRKMTSLRGEIVKALLIKNIMFRHDCFAPIRFLFYLLLLFATMFLLDSVFSGCAFTMNISLIFPRTSEASCLRKYTVGTVKRRFTKRHQLCLSVYYINNLFLCLFCFRNWKKRKIVVHFRIFIIINHYILFSCEVPKFSCIRKEQLMSSNKQRNLC